MQHSEANYDQSAQIEVDYQWDEDVKLSEEKRDIEAFGSEAKYYIFRTNSPCSCDPDFKPITDSPCKCFSE